MDATSGVAGVLWWIGVVSIFVLVIPVVLILAHRLIGVIAEIKRYADDVRDHGAAVAVNVESVSALTDTRARVQRTAESLGSYARALEQRLGGRG